MNVKNYMKKGIDSKFVHYGIRKDDLAMIESICLQEGIDFDKDNMAELGMGKKYKKINVTHLI